MGGSHQASVQVQHHFVLRPNGIRPRVREVLDGSVEPQIDNSAEPLTCPLNRARVRGTRFPGQGPFAFGRKRRAIILCGGDKSGGSEKRFYRQLIDKADERFDAHQPDHLASTEKKTRSLMEHAGRVKWLCEKKAGEHLGARSRWAELLQRVCHSKLPNRRFSANFANSVNWKPTTYVESAAYGRTNPSSPRSLINSSTAMSPR